MLQCGVYCYPILIILYISSLLIYTNKKIYLEVVDYSLSISNPLSIASSSAMAIGSFRFSNVPLWGNLSSIWSTVNPTLINSKRMLLLSLLWTKTGSLPMTVMLLERKVFFDNILNCAHYVTKTINDFIYSWLCY